MQYEVKERTAAMVRMLPDFCCCFYYYWIEYNRVEAAVREMTIVDQCEGGHRD